MKIEDFDPDLGNGGIIVKEMKSQGEGIPLPEAELVVSAGRGLKGPENWGIVEDLFELDNMGPWVAFFIFKDMDSHPKMSG